MTELGFGASRPLGTQTSVLDHSVGVTTAHRRQPRDLQTTLARVHSTEGSPSSHTTTRSSSTIALITAKTLNAHPELRHLCTAVPPTMKDAALLTASASSSELITARGDALALDDSVTQLPADTSMQQTAAEKMTLQTAAEDAAMRTGVQNMTMQPAAETSQLVTARGPRLSVSMTRVYPVATDVEYVDATSTRSATMPIPSSPRLTHVPATPPYSTGSRTSVARSPSMLNTAVDYLTTTRPMESQLLTTNHSFDTDESPDRVVELEREVESLRAQLDAIQQLVPKTQEELAEGGATLVDVIRQQFVNFEKLKMDMSSSMLEREANNTTIQSINEERAKSQSHIDLLVKQLKVSHDSQLRKILQIVQREETRHIRETTNDYDLFDEEFATEASSKVIFQLSRERYLTYMREFESDESIAIVDMWSAEDHLRVQDLRKVVKKHLSKITYINCAERWLQEEDLDLEVIDDITNEYSAIEKESTPEGRQNEGRHWASKVTSWGKRLHRAYVKTGSFDEVGGPEMAILSALHAKYTFVLFYIQKGKCECCDNHANSCGMRL